MEIQLQELIDKIKKEGIETASQDAAKIKQEAETERERIISAARKEATTLLDRAKSDAEKAEKAGKVALEQASRNLLLVFKGEVQALLDRLVTEKVAASYDEDALKKVLPEILKAWAARSDSASVDLLLGEGDLAKLKTWASGTLAAELKKGVELKHDRNLATGFRVAQKDGSAYYDFSAESVAGLLSAYLNPTLAEIMKASGASPKEGA